MLPSWQTQQLDTLSSQGKLSGLPPSVLAAIDIEESGGYGGGINPQGYGGWFGLGVGQAGSGLLGATDPAAFDAQAQMAAADYATQLQRYGGNTYQAETAYQNGSYNGSFSPGVSVFQELGIPQSIGSGAGIPDATLTGFPGASGGGSGNQPDGTGGTFNILSTPIGNVGVAKSTVVRMTIGLVAVLLLYLGMKELFGSKAPTEIVVSGAQSGREYTTGKARAVHHHVRDAASTVAAAAAT